MDPGSTLLLIDVELVSFGSAGLAIGSVGSAPEHTTVDVRRSTFDFSLGLDLSPGLSSFADGGRLVFTQSSARAAAIRLSGSELGDDGVAFVTRSQLVSTLANIDIGASAGESGGVVHAVGNDITSAGRIGIHAGGGGLPATVRAIHNDLMSTLDTVISAGGSTCFSLLNSPAVACT